MQNLCLNQQIIVWDTQPQDISNNQKSSQNRWENYKQDYMLMLKLKKIGTQDISNNHKSNQNRRENYKQNFMQSVCLNQQIIFWDTQDISNNQKSKQNRKENYEQA